MKDERVGRLERLMAERMESMKSINAAALAEKVKNRVIGQDDAVEWFAHMISATIARNVLVVTGRQQAEDLPRLSSLWIVGPTASGKTHMVRTFADELGMPLRTVDCTSLTGTGWRGGNIDVEMADVASLLDDDPHAFVIVLFDEADKLAFANTSTERSFNAQPGLLKILDTGTYFGGTKESERFKLDTNRCIFVFAGAFTGIENIVQKRLDSRRSAYGFAANESSRAERALSNDELRSRIEPTDLVDWGLMPEFLGRITSMHHMPAIGKDALTAIVKNGEHSLEDKLSRLMPNKMRVEIDDKAAEAIADMALASGFGARQLESIAAPLVAQARAEALRNPDAEAVRIALANGELNATLTIETPSWENGALNDETR